MIDGCNCFIFITAKHLQHKYHHDGQWRDTVNTAMNLLFLYKARNFLVS